jgi:glycosyltransferase involved in cell wall biosynthesis
LPELEVVFVEGHSTDGTWDEIQRLMPRYAAEFKIAAFQQTGQGKGDAVRLGFGQATGDVVTILDADLTVPASALPRFYLAYRDGLGDFINGSRLVYGTESGAMRPLNTLGNILFAKAVSSVLSVRLGDSLCGTKLFARHDCARFTRWRGDFGDFDPFGDFEMLFPAAILALGIVDLPIRYLARTYGETNISRFRHGWMLLKMTVIGFIGVRLGAAR